jgi:hypothetical protein
MRWASLLLLALIEGALFQEDRYDQEIELIRNVRIFTLQNIFQRAVIYFLIFSYKDNCTLLLRINEISKDKSQNH